MSLFHKRAPFILLITALLGLSSCQEKENILPVETTTPSSGARLESAIGPIVSNPQVYKMTNRGAAVLSYLTDGKLSEVTETGFYKNYVYGYQTMTTSMNVSENSVITYMYKQNSYLNAQGRVTKTVLETTYPKGAPARTEMFEYYANGQLKKHYSLSNPLIHTDYTYNAAGDLTLAIGYDASGKVKQKVTLYYTGFGNDPMLNNPYPLNPEFDMFDVDKRIYGKFSNHLARRITIQVNNPSIPNALKFYFLYKIK